MFPISDPLSFPVPRWFSFSGYGCSSCASGDEVVLPSTAQGCCQQTHPPLRQPLLQLRLWDAELWCNLGRSNLGISNTKSQLLSDSLFRESSHKTENKTQLKNSGGRWGSAAQNSLFLSSKEKRAREGWREITYSTIYCPKITSSTKGATIIIGEKKHSPLTCEGDLQHISLSQHKSQELQTHRGCSAWDHVEGHLTAWHCAAQHFKMHPIKTQIQLW